MRRSALILVALALPASIPAQEAKGTRERLEAEVPRLLELADVPGLAVALVEEDGEVWTRGFGRRSAASDEPVDDETVFAAASLGKPVFAYAVLQLVDQGIIELDRPLVSYAPLDELAHDARREKLTTRMVLCHTTGLPNWRAPGARLELEADPGARWNYSGEGFVLLQRVVEHVTGTSLEELARELVFEPLGMTRSSFITPEDSAHFAPAHDEHGDVIDVASLSLLERKGRRSNAAASLCCTAGDYGRFLAALLAGTGLSESTRRALATPQVEVGPGVAWGLGLGLEQRADGYALWQWGHNTGYRAFALVDPARRSAFVFLSNGDGGMLILRDLLKLASGDAEHPALAHLHYESYDSPGR